MTYANQPETGRNPRGYRFVFICFFFTSDPILVLRVVDLVLQSEVVDLAVCVELRDLSAKIRRTNSTRRYQTTMRVRYKKPYAWWNCTTTYGASRTASINFLSSIPLARKSGPGFEKGLMCCPRYSISWSFAKHSSGRLRFHQKTNNCCLTLFL